MRKNNKKDSNKISENSKNSVSESSHHISEKNIDYFKDNALDSKDGDKFKHLHYVKVIKDILLKSDTPINIGLYGKWGVGKSSIAHMLKEAISNDEKLKEFKYVEIDAWGLSHASLQQGILEEVYFQLGEKVYKQNKIEDELYNVQQVDVNDFSVIKKFWWVWLLIVGIGSLALIFDNTIDVITKISAIGLSSILALLFPLTKLFVGTSKRIIPKTTSSRKFREIYNNITNESGKKIVVVIDNLDRCNDEIAVELLGLIQTFMVKKNCINILACDDEAIITHLRNVKGKQYTDRDGNEFLSKFFQVTLRIPPFIGENLEKYTEDLMKKRSITFDPFVRQILISGAVENPRKINQFLNNVVALYRLAELKENDKKLPKGIITKHTAFLTKLIILRHEWPEFHKAIEEQPEILNDENLFKGWINARNEYDNEKEIHSIHALQKFLNRTQMAYVDNVIPFLRLNQESYAAESGMDEFGTAVITLNPNATKIFKKSKKQNQYLKKIEELMEEHAEKKDQLTLVNCTLSLIDILKSIKNPEERNIALATLGKYLSDSLLDQWDKFDLNKHNMFNILEEMQRHFSVKFYEKLISEIFSQDKINEKLLLQFMENGSKISTNIMDMVDDELSKSVPKQLDNLGFIVECCEVHHWNQNNITKPSKTMSALLEHVTFDSESTDSLCRDIYEKIKKDIDISERELFLEQVKLAIQQFTHNGQALPEPLMDAIKDISTDDNENITQTTKLFKILSDHMGNISERGQAEILFNIIIHLAEKVKKSSNISVNVNTQLKRTAIAYLENANHEEILNFFNKPNLKKQEFLKSKTVMSALIERFIVIGIDNEEILRYLLLSTPYETQDTITEKLCKFIQSNDMTEYSTLLNVAQELDLDFNYSIIDSIRETCKELASVQDSDRTTFFQHVLKLKPSYGDIQEIADYAENLILSQETVKQDEGLELLQTLNSNDDFTNLRGIEKALEQSIVFLQNNPTRLSIYLTFIFKYSDRWTFSQQTKLKKLFRKGLKPERTEEILGLVLSYIDSTQEEIVKDIFNELIKCAEQTSFDSSRKRIKSILIRNKNALYRKQEDRIKEIYGDSILD